MGYKVKDCVHDGFLPDYVEDVINSDEFRRLENLKQLGKFLFLVKLQPSYNE